MSEDKETRPALNLDELEGLRGDGVAKWYVVHTYSGHENKVKVNIEKLVESRGMQDLILDVVVPTEDRVEIKNGQRKIKTKKLIPSLQRKAMRGTSMTIARTIGQSEKRSSLSLNSRKSK